MESQVHIPNEFYTLVGVLIITNLSTIATFLKSQFNKGVELALIKQQMINMEKAIEELKKENDNLRQIVMSLHAKVQK